MDVLTKEERHRNMSAIKGRDTKPELYFRKEMFRLGFRYRICPSGVVGHPDVWLPKYRTAIFINGCFWHAHEGCRYFKIPESNREFWEDKFRKNRDRDRRITDNLLDSGKRVIVLWECVIRKMRSDSVVHDDVLRHVEEFLVSSARFMEIEWSEDEEKPGITVF